MAKSCIVFTPIDSGNLPKEDALVLLSSVDGYWIGKYQGNGTFKLHSRTELREDGSFRQLFMDSVVKDYFIGWLYIEIDSYSCLQDFIDVNQNKYDVDEFEV